MVKTITPLLSNTASGSIAKRLTYSLHKNVKQVRYQKAQKDYENNARKTARDPFRWGVELWNSMPQNEKDYWVEIEKNGYVDV